MEQKKKNEIIKTDWKNDYGIFIIKMDKFLHLENCLEGINYRALHRRHGAVRLEAAFHLTLAVDEELGEIPLDIAGALTFQPHI